jgi:hypothetical protein
MASSIYKDEKTNRYTVVFYKEAPFKTYTNIGQYKAEKDAVKAANKAEIEFYTKHTYLLPKGVSIQDGTFYLRVKADLLNGVHLRNIASSKTLAEMKDKRKFILESLIY